MGGIDCRWCFVLALATTGCGTQDLPATAGSGERGSTAAAASTTALGTTAAQPPGNDSTTGDPPPPEPDGTGDTTGEPLLGPPYPLLLAHGFFGFENLADLRFVPYWHGIPEHLASVGEQAVCIGEVDPFNDSTDRGMQLLEQAIDCAAATGHARVNIIGHSQGGLDARVVASVAPDLVASVTTIATPHYGTPIADLVAGASPNDGSVLVDWLVQTLGAPLWDQVGNQTSLAEAMWQMSSEGIAQFNAMYPDAPGVLYTSVTGRTGLHPGGPDCEPTSPPNPLFISTWDDTLDTTDALFLIPEAILSDGIFAQDPNDGLVRAVDARWGQFLGCVPADHIDEVGHLLGDAPGIGNAWDHLTFYGALVSHLRDQGV